MIGAAQRLILLFLFTFSFSASAAVCDQVWMHMGGVSKHIEVYTPKPYTKYRRQTHPGVGVECKTPWVSLAGGEFTNSLDHEFRYVSVTKDLWSFAGFTLYAGMMGAQYGLDQGPSRFAMPTVYLEYQRNHVGVNFFALPPAQGWNDYLVLFAQIKIGF